MENPQDQSGWRRMSAAAERARTALDRWARVGEQAQRRLAADGNQMPLEDFTEEQHGHYRQVVGFLEFPVRDQRVLEDGLLWVHLEFPLYWTRECTPLEVGQSVTMMAQTLRDHGHIVSVEEQAAVIQVSGRSIEPITLEEGERPNVVIRCPQVIEQQPDDYFARN